MAPQPSIEMKRLLRIPSFWILRMHLLRCDIIGIWLGGFEGASIFACLLTLSEWPSTTATDMFKITSLSMGSVPHSGNHFLVRKVAQVAGMVEMVIHEVMGVVAK
jgi:hypothetical protein